jgi:hypothetical protein
MPAIICDAKKCKYETIFGQPFEMTDVFFGQD